MGYIEELLDKTAQKYDNVAAAPGDSAECLRKLKEITKGISSQVQKYIRICEQRMDDNNNYQKKCLDQRADLYEKCRRDTKLLSELDAQRVKIASGISDMQSEISAGKKEIDILTQEQLKKKGQGVLGKGMVGDLLDTFREYRNRNQDRGRRQAV